MSIRSSTDAFPAIARHVLYLGKARVEMAFRLVPAGEFWMGQRGERDRESELARHTVALFEPSSPEEPRHKVVISQPFWMGETPVTQEQFRVWTKEKGIGHQNHFEGHPAHPAENLDWHQAAGFCDWLNSVMREQLPAGFAASLPSEAQWEYACRAGTETEFHNGDGEAGLEEAGWFGKNAGNSTHSVGMKKPNPFGLHDVHGNVWEWCLDVWDLKAYRRRIDGIVDPVVLTDAEGSKDPIRMVRGGCWSVDAERCRSACRNWSAPEIRHYMQGLRVCLVRSLVVFPERSG